MNTDRVKEQRPSSNGVVTAPLSRASRRTDAKPWFRQFWPWFLIALPAVSVVFSFATLYVAVHDADEVLPHEGDSTSYSAPSGPARTAPQAAAANRIASDAATATNRVPSATPAADNRRDDPAAAAQRRIP